MNTPSRATSYDVARLAGVSQSAVSRCFKPGASISAKMRERVMRAARELGYQPNAMARSLITRRSGLVAVLVGSSMSFYYPEMLSQLTQQLSDRGMRALLFTVDSEEDVEAILDPIWQYSVDGVVSASHLSTVQFERLQERGTPVLMFNRWFEDRQTDTVWADSTTAVQELIDEQVSGGHSRFALLRGPDGSMVGRLRAQQVERALDMHGLSLVGSALGDYSYASGQAAVDALLRGRPTTIVASNDMMAMGVMDGLRHEHDVRVPDDVSVAGFDGITSGQFAAYQLTTIRQPIGRMTEAAVDMLMLRIAREDVSSERRELQSVLRFGQSTAPVSTEKDAP